MNTKLTFEALEKAIKMVKGDCDHTLYYANEDYTFGTCKCRLHEFILCPPELRRWYDEMISQSPKPDHEPEEIFGIKVYRS